MSEMYSQDRKELAKKALQLHSKKDTLSGYDIDYIDIVKAAALVNGVEIIQDSILQVDDDDYEGDSAIICQVKQNNTVSNNKWPFEQGKDYCYVTWGWGSCSGCDALQGCGSIDDLADLTLDILRSMIPLKKEEILQYLEKEKQNNAYLQDLLNNLIKAYKEKEQEI